jgi:hypothetical protein
MLDVFDTRQEVDRFFRTEDDRQGLGLFRCRNDVFEDPIFVEGHPVQEPQSTNGNQDRTWSQFLFLCQVDLVGTNVFRAKIFR